jgi:hypothetical protein
MPKKTLADENGQTRTVEDSSGPSKTVGGSLGQFGAVGESQKTPNSPQLPSTALNGPQLFTVRLKPGHPTGVYHRAGIMFTATAPTVLDTVPVEVTYDPWLLVTPKG